jgi:transglutaminase-like putative cysteine protease
MSIKRVPGLLLFAILSAASVAQESTPAPAARAHEASLTIVRDESTYDVRADGGYTLEAFESIRLNNAQGVRQRGQIPLRYSASLQDLDVLEAYTTTQDGRRIDVESDKIIQQQSPQSANAPMFDDAKVKTVIFPAADVGSVLTLHWRFTQKQPLFPGAFSMVKVFPRTSDVRHSVVTLRAPASLEMHIDAIGVDGGTVPTDTPQGKLWRWTVPAAPAHIAEIGSVNAIDFSPRVVATTFASYDLAGKAYLERARPKAAVTPEIQRLADHITQGIPDRRSQAEALYEWVSRNVRYVAIFLGFGGVVPHDADAVAAARYGDCKDHVSLLEALLAAKGIKSSPVLVNLGDAYTVPRVASTPGVFNHAISFLPEFDVFVDSTVGVARFGVLPVQERGKPALLTDDGNGSAKLVTLPPTDRTHDTVQVETRLAVDGEGTIAGGSKVAQTGVFDVAARQIFMGIPEAMKPQFAARLLAMTGQSGTGTFVHGDLRDMSNAFEYSTRFTLPNAVPVPGPGALTVPVALGSLSGIYSVFEHMVAPRRDFPIVMVSGRREETTVLTLPESVSVSQLPRAVVIESALGHYESSYAQDGHTLTIRRLLELKLPSPVVGADDYQQLRALAAGVNRDLRAQIVYQ